MTDATVDIAGSYQHKNGKYRFSGDFTADLLSNPNLDRAYDIGVTFVLRGKTVLDRTISSSRVSSSPFSVKDVLKGNIGGSGLARLLRGLDVDGKVTSASTSATGSFDSRLGKGQSGALHAACMSLFSRNAAKKCGGPNDFNIAFAFNYDDPVAPLPERGTPEQGDLPAPVPLPAGLPLLGAGIAAFAAVRRRR